MPSGTELQVGQRFGPFLLEARLGEGGAGVVFLALDERANRHVALKVLKGEAGTGFSERRFAHEARTAREVKHKHLVPLLDAGDVNGRAFLAAEYVDGRSLARWIEEEGPLPVDTIVRLAAEVGSGLDALHEEGVVHRDVKPSNILVDRGGKAMLSDFGLSKGRAYSSLTKAGQVLGTLHYMAPEVISGKPATPASDIYSLGCVVYECAAGKPPFAGKGVFELGVAHMDLEPPHPAAARSGLADGFCWALLRALIKEPAERPPSAVAYATMLRVGSGQAR